MYSEKILLDLCTMNSVSNKEKRRDYVLSLMDKMGQGKFMKLWYSSMRAKNPGPFSERNSLLCKVPDFKRKEYPYHSWHIARTDALGESQRKLQTWWLLRMCSSYATSRNRTFHQRCNSMWQRPCSLCCRNSFWWWLIFMCYVAPSKSIQCPNQSNRGMLEHYESQN